MNKKIYHNQVIDLSDGHYAKVYPDLKDGSKIFKTVDNQKLCRYTLTIWKDYRGEKEKKFKLRFYGPEFLDYKEGTEVLELPPYYEKEGVYLKKAYSFFQTNYVLSPKNTKWLTFWGDDGELETEDWTFDSRNKKTLKL